MAKKHPKIPPGKGLFEQIKEYKTHVIRGRDLTKEEVEEFFRQYAKQKGSTGSKWIIPYRASVDVFKNKKK